MVLIHTIHTTDDNDEDISLSASTPRTMWIHMGVSSFSDRQEEHGPEMNLRVDPGSVTVVVRPCVSESGGLALSERATRVDLVPSDPARTTP